MNRFEEMLENIKKDMKKKKITGLILSKELKVSNTTISHTLNGKHATAKLLKKICEYVAEK